MTLSNTRLRTTDRFSIYTEISLSSDLVLSSIQSFFEIGIGFAVEGHEETAYTEIKFGRTGSPLDPDFVSSYNLGPDDPEGSSEVIPFSDRFRFRISVDSDNKRAFTYLRGQEDPAERLLGVLNTRWIDEQYPDAELIVYLWVNLFDVDLNPGNFRFGGFTLEDFNPPSKPEPIQLGIRHLFDQKRIELRFVAEAGDRVTILSGPDPRFLAPRETINVTKSGTQRVTYPLFDGDGGEFFDGSRFSF